MNCAHGTPMDMMFPACGPKYRITANKPPTLDQLFDRLADSQLALARAIQGLSGNVAQLVEYAEGMEKSK